MGPPPVLPSEATLRSSRSTRPMAGSRPLPKRCGSRAPLAVYVS